MLVTGRYVSCGVSYMPACISLILDIRPPARPGVPPSWCAGGDYHLAFAFYFRRERVDPNAQTLSGKVDELEGANEAENEEEEEVYFDDEPKYVDSLVPWAVAS